MEKRIIKVGYTWYKRTNNYAKFPKIQLSGKWLKENGIYEGDEVEVVSEKECIIIKKRT